MKPSISIKVYKANGEKLETSIITGKEAINFIREHQPISFMIWDWSQNCELSKNALYRLIQTNLA